MAISHGNGMMRAQSFSIQVSDRVRCNGGCKFCISRTTPNSTGIVKDSSEIRTCELTRLETGLNYAKYLGATHAILTGKADPSQENHDYLMTLIQAARRHLPLVDMHTNGFLYLPEKAHAKEFEQLVSCGLTMITLSIASFDEDENQSLMRLKQSGADLIPIARELGLLVRCSLVVNKKGINDIDGLMSYIYALGGLGAQMVVVREIWLPESDQEDSEVYQWNRENFLPIEPLQHRFMAMATEKDNVQQRDPLPWGTPVFAVSGFNNKNHGVNVTFARCDEANSGSLMKSIVHKPDGHGYRNWDHNGDILY